VIATVLERYGIPFVIRAGFATLFREPTSMSEEAGHLSPTPDAVIDPHFWVTFEFQNATWVADYRMRMWAPSLGDIVPHGVFRQREQHKHLRYHGVATELGAVPDLVFRVLTMRSER
jgi:hypothetical protein